MNNKVIQFEPFKNAKQWDDEYSKFLGNVEKHFGAKTDPEAMGKRLYYALRYLNGVINSFWIFELAGIEQSQKGKKFCKDWLLEMAGKL